MSPPHHHGIELWQHPAGSSFNSEGRHKHLAPAHKKPSSIQPSVSPFMRPVVHLLNPPRPSPLKCFRFVVAINICLRAKHFRLSASASLSPHGKTACPFVHESVRASSTPFRWEHFRLVLSITAFAITLCWQWLPPYGPHSYNMESVSLSMRPSSNFCSQLVPVSTPAQWLTNTYDATQL